MDQTSVILAVGSPPGRSVRGIVRLSGDEAFDLLQEHLELSAQPVEAWPRGVHRARLRLPFGELPVLAVLFPAPHSYTGQHAAELQLPGNPLLLERVIDALLDSARARDIEARRAEPGEFTARAYFNDKLTLTQAEGVAATIAARSDAELRAAQLLLSDSLGKTARRLADDLAAALALVEAGIDFTDQEDVIAIGPAELLARLIAVRDAIVEQLAHAVGMEQLEAIPQVVLAGEPNAGKSTLFNALLGRERAVVCETAGTTRDVLAEPLTIQTDHGPAEVMLIDRAGADKRDPSVLNRQMQTAAKLALDRADLVLRCVPIGEQVDSTPTSSELLIRTKSDLADHAEGCPAGQLVVSASTGEGLAALERTIAERLAERAVSFVSDAVALRPRHEAALRDAKAELDQAIMLVEPIASQRGLSEPELIAASMRGGLDHLAALAGAITPDDVLGRVFATFCVGK